MNHLVNAEQIKEFQLRNAAGMSVTALNLGCRITAIVTPDKNGNLDNVVLAYANNEQYLQDQLYFGAVVGRFCNRIKDGKLTLDGQEYQLAINNGPHALHGGIVGFDAVIWDVEEVTLPEGPSLVFTHLSPDGHEQYPGNLTVTVTYTLTEENSLNISYRATTDKTTVVNFTQHSYFDLSSGNVKAPMQHELMINADMYLPTDETAIPLAEAPVSLVDTPFDFRKTELIANKLDWENKQIAMAEGFDHTYVLNKSEGDELSHAAVLMDKQSGRRMDVYTTEPGMQLYTANFIGDNKHTAVCLETQHYPGSPHRDDFPTTVLEPGEVFLSQTQYKFSVE